jgi:hypothetical protein
MVKFTIELWRTPCHVLGMARNQRFGFQTPYSSYAAVEHALAAMMGTTDTATQEGQLRGRLKRLLVLGLPPAGPGKGTRRRYSWEEVCQLGIALLLEDADVEPVAVVQALQNVWRHVANKVRLAADCPADNPMMLTVRLTAVSGPWRTGDPVSAMPWITIDRRIDERAYARYRKQGLTHEAAHLRADNVLLLINRNEPGWVATIDLTAALSKLQAALHEKVH